MNPALRQRLGRFLVLAISVASGACASLLGIDEDYVLDERQTLSSGGSAGSMAGGSGGVTGGSPSQTGGSVSTRLDSGSKDSPSEADSAIAECASNQDCAEGMKCCLNLPGPFSALCVAPPLERIGCWQEGCAQCPFVSLFGQAACQTDGTCGIECAAGYRLVSNQCEPIPQPDSGTGTGGAPGSGGTPATGGASTGGMPALCERDACPLDQCNVIRGFFPCCNRRNECGCTWSPSALYCP
jgi:hypothetical protein